MKPWQSQVVALSFAFAVGFIGCFQLVASQPPDKFSYDQGYAEGFDKGQAFGAKNGYPDEGLMTILPALAFLVGGVALVGLIVAFVRFKYGKDPKWDACRPACISYPRGHDPRCPLSAKAET